MIEDMREIDEEWNEDGEEVYFGIEKKYCLPFAVIDAFTTLSSSFFVSLLWL